LVNNVFFRRPFRAIQSIDVMSNRNQSHPSTRHRISIRTTFAKRRAGSPRDSTPPALLISPLIAVQFVMRDTLQPAAFVSAWASFMAGYREHFRAGGLAAANTLAVLELSRLAKRPRSTREDQHYLQPHGDSHE
jgi:hypothetical protein